LRERPQARPALIRGWWWSTYYSGHARESGILIAGAHYTHDRCASDPRRAGRRPHRDRRQAAVGRASPAYEGRRADSAVPLRRARSTRSMACVPVVELGRLARAGVGTGSRRFRSSRLLVAGRAVSGADRNHDGRSRRAGVPVRLRADSGADAETGARAAAPASGQCTCRDPATSGSPPAQHRGEPGAAVALPERITSSTRAGPSRGRLTNDGRRAADPGAAHETYSVHVENIAGGSVRDVTLDPTPRPRVRPRMRCGRMSPEETLAAPRYAARQAPPHPSRMATTVTRRRR